MILERKLPIVSLEKISFRYRSKTIPKSSFEIKGLDLIINDGEFISILGANGGGKSTLLKLFAGILKPSGGRVLFRGQDISKLKRNDFAKKAAYVSQNVDKNFPFTIYEIVMMGRSPYLGLFGYEKEEDMKFVDEILKSADLYDKRNKSINETSGGEARRAYIARALAQAPEIIFLDEPNAHLDIKHQFSIFNILKKLNLEKETTIVTVTHDINLAKVYSDRIIIFSEGKITADGSPRETLTEETLQKAFQIDIGNEKGASSHGIDYFSTIASFYNK